jgi:hypothetical protein
MIAIAYVLIDAIFDTQSSLTGGLQLSHPRFDASLPL